MSENKGSLRRGSEMLRNAAAITEQRGAIYSHPREDFDRAARLKAVVQDCPDPLMRHVLEMICVKIARLCSTPHHEDSLIDIAGYAACGFDLIDPPPDAQT